MRDPIQCPHCKQPLTDNEASSIAAEVESRRLADVLADSDALVAAAVAAASDDMSALVVDTEPFEPPPFEPIQLEPMPTCGSLECHHPDHQPARPGSRPKKGARK